MFPLFSRSKYFDYAGATDWHSHILPGVDDGISDIETSLAVLAEYEKMGIKEVWLTPHIMEDVPNTPSELTRVFNNLQSAYCGEITLHLAAENMIDELFFERLRADDLLPIGNKRDMLLVETSTFSAPMDLEGAFAAIKSKGYHPLFAHPERYSYIQSIAEYKRLKDAGVRFQLNLLSLAGAYGKGVQQKARDLLKAGMYNKFGSDLHRLSQTQHLRTIKLPTPVIHSLSQL